MSIYDISGNEIIADSKEVWVDNYSTIEDALADGSIINFTSGKTYEVDHSIVINKPCRINGNGCVLQAEAKEPTTEDSRAYYYIFDVKSDGVIITDFNAVSEDLYPWQNGSVIYPDTITSNVYFSRISASNVEISNIFTNHLCGAVRVADDANSEEFSYHDVRIDNITCLDGTINIYIGNVIRCVVNNLTLSTNVHNDTLGHAIYISRGVKHIAIDNFTIYNNYGMYGGISIHPSSSTDPSLTSYIAISNGVIYSIADESYAFQITCAQHITISNVITESINGAKAVSFSQKVTDVTFNGCVLKGENAVIRCAVHDVEKQIVFNGCKFYCIVTQSTFDAMRRIQGILFNACEFYLEKTGSVLSPSGHLLNVNYYGTDKHYGITMANCNVIINDDIVMHILEDYSTIENDVLIANCVFDSNTQVATLTDSGITHSIVEFHNVVAKGYGSLTANGGN